MKFLTLFSGVIFLFIAVLIVGPIDFNWNDPTWQDIFWQLRLPKALAATFGAAALGLSGLLMQTFFQNPLADPFVLGIQSGSSFGVAIWLMAAGIFPPVFYEFGITVFAIAGAIGVLLLLIFASHFFNGKIILLILGLILGHLIGGIIQVLVALSDASSVKSYLLWSLGSFEKISIDQLWWPVSIIVFGVVMATLLIKTLNTLLLGDRYAHSLGLNLHRTKIQIVLLTGLLTGVVTAFCGPISFVGIIVPHLARSIFKTSDHKILLPAVILIGSFVGLFTQLIATYALIPLSAIMGLLGAPIVLLYLWHKRKLEQL